MRGLLAIACCTLALICARASNADTQPAVVVRMIINAKNPVAKLDKRFVEEAFLKKRTRWNDDSVIQPVDLGQKSDVRDKFCHDVLERDIASVRRYWAQLVFSGRGVPPPELAADTDVVKYVASHAGAIGYVSGTTSLVGVKTVEIQ